MRTPPDDCPDPLSTPEVLAALRDLEAAIALDHGPDHCCAVCAMYKQLLAGLGRVVQQEKARMAHNMADLRRRVAEQEQTLAEHGEILQEWRLWKPQHEQRQAALEVVYEDYEALQDAHEALQLEFEDLQAAYYVAQRELRRREKEGKTEDDLS